MDKLFSVAASPLSFIILISIVITVHELGHYYVGRIFGAAAESFSIGFGKSIFEVKDKRGTRWRINWLPLGGFVKFVGEMQAPTDGLGAPVERPIGKSYPELGPWKRIAVSLGGPFANFIFAIVVFGALGMGVGVPQATEVRVKQVEVGSPAEAAGFKPGDIVRSAGGRPVNISDDVKGATFLRAGESVRYSVIRDGQPMELTAVPVEHAEHNEIFKVTEKVGRIGLALEDRGANIRHLNPVEAVGYASPRQPTPSATRLTCCVVWSRARTASRR
jgi:regulator of sigma E protease